MTQDFFAESVVRRDSKLNTNIIVGHVYCLRYFSTIVDRLADMDFSFH